MVDKDGNGLPLLTGVMTHENMRKLVTHWAESITYKKPMACGHKMTIDGKVTYLGLVVSNIQAITAIEIEPPAPTVSEA